MRVPGWVFGFDYELNFERVCFGLYWDFFRFDVEILALSLYYLFWVSLLLRFGLDFA